MSPFWCAAVHLLVALLQASAFSPPPFESHLLLDEPANLTLHWTADVALDVLRLCVTAPCLPSQYLSLGFSAGHRMRDTDIVAAFLAPGSGQPMVRSYYAARSVGFPDGPPTLAITEPMAQFMDRTATLCFTRPFASGHHVVGAATWVSWAIGHLWNGDLDDHGTQRGQRQVDFLPSAGTPSEL
eukprot:EG_transcript_22489